MIFSFENINTMLFIYAGSSGYLSVISIKYSWADLYLV